MKNKEVESKIRHAYTQATPDVLDGVLARCSQEKGNVITMTRNNPRRTWVKVAAMAASLVLVLGLSLGFYNYTSTNTVETVVGLDVNPSLELQLNKNETVLAVNARNEDGKKILGDMDLKGSSLDVAVNALLGSMLRGGYLSDLQNSILVSVENKDPEKSARLEAALSEKVNALLSTDTFQGAVLSQTVTQDQTLQNLADSHGISLGKAQLIQKILEKHPLYTFADLAKLSINELNLLAGQETLEGVNTSGTASDKQYVGAEAARDAALHHAGITGDAAIAHIGLELEDGVMVYEVDFSHNNCAYEYEINAVTGQVHHHEMEHHDKDDDDHDDKHNSGHHEDHRDEEDDVVIPSDSYITAEKAKSIAFQHAGVYASDTAPAYRNLECELEMENGIATYEISFEMGTWEYDYHIHAQTGEILRCEKEADD